MFSSNRLTNWILSIALVFASGCSTSGLGCSCMEMTPLADLGLAVPTDQTIEGGAQVRVTPAGFAKLTEVVPAVFQDALGDGMCIAEGGQSVELFSFEIASLSWCYTNQGGACPGHGCLVQFSDIHTGFSAPNNDVLRVDARLDVNALVPVNVYLIVIIDMDCTINIDAQDIHVVADIGFDIDPTDGELGLHLEGIQDLDLSGITVDIQGCGIINEVDNFLNLMFDVLSSPIGTFVINLLTPVIDDLIQGMLPDPLGFEHLIDLGAFLGTLSPGTHATMETRMVPGGYVSLYGGGMSLGIITGLNADEDLVTRTPDLDSEPAYCVPPIAAPDFTQPAPGLPQVTRSALGGNVFSLAPAGAFLGQPDPAAEIAIGLSETTLDLAGHHMVTSGAMCLGVGTELISMLNLGTIGILVPSLAELGSEDGTDPLLLVTRPQEAIDFSIGEGTEEDPSLTIHLRHFEVDIYAFLFERYVRGLTLELGIDLGINLEFTTTETGEPAILPTLIGLEADNIELTVHNAEFLRESTDTLEAVLPAIFDMIAPLISDGLGAIALPQFAGFTLTNLQVQKVVTAEDNFLALYATLGAATSSAFTKLAERYPRVAEWVEQQKAPPVERPANPPQARLISVHTPPPAVFRRGYANLPGGQTPEVVVEVDAYDDLGRELEWTWSPDGGLWRPFQRPSALGQLTIHDRAYGFALQGRHTIELRSRVVGDYQTLDRASISIPVVIDSVGPRILSSKTHIEDGKLVVTASDLVSPAEAVELSFGAIGDPGPATDWSHQPLDLNTALHLANADKQLMVWARDELGNQSSAIIDLGPMVNLQQVGDAGCGCAAGGSDTRSGLGAGLLAALTFLLLGLRRRRAVARVARGWGGYLAVLLLGLAGSLSAGCSCGADPSGEACVIDEDCADFCPENTIPICFEGQCVCADDVPLGRIGQYSDLDLSSSGAAWVSAYNWSHGDLMVARWPGDGRIADDAWEFLDGVPDGPVILPESDVRGGIFAAGEDTGLYTSIAVAPDDTVMISYFDKEHAGLKFISNAGGVWASHTVDAGSDNIDPEIGYEIAGQYSSITVRRDDGRPAIAYFAQVSEVTSVRTEVRYAAAQNANPTGPQDWNIWIVDEEIMPPPDPAAPDVYPIPLGVGLFVDSARMSDESPVLVYYDRIHGYLKVARFDALAGTFQEPEILDGEHGVDVGWYPSVVVDAIDDLHISYVDADNNDLYYLTTANNTPQLVDDGYRIVGTTAEGLPKPEFHFVGDDSSLVLTTAGPIIVYQDATTHELLLAQRNGSDMWEYEAMAGTEDPFVGGYGFYAASKYDGTHVVMSNWVVDQPANDAWVEVFRKTIVVQ